MHFTAIMVEADVVLPFRARQREEIHGQIVHDSIHRRPGWTRTYRLDLDGVAAGFGSVAIGGPWTGKPTFFEFYVVRGHRSAAFELFEAFRAASAPQFLEVQTNDALPTVMALTFGRDFGVEKIVFRDGLTTALPANGAVVRAVTPAAEVRESMERRQGGGEWVVDLNGAEVARGGILFHYNRPYADLHMEVAEPHRRRGLGSYLIQELKRLCCELGAIPCARCSPENVASRRTLQRAGFVPCANMLTGTLSSAASASTLV